MSPLLSSFIHSFLTFPAFLSLLSAPMALRSLASKFWKPVAVAGSTVYGSYGVYEWNKAKSVLHLEDMGRDQLGQLFDSIDTKKSGYIDVEELNTALQKSAKNKFRSADVKAMLAVADEDHDGKLGKDEFIHICECVTTKSAQTVPKKISKSSMEKTTHVNEEALMDEYAVVPPQFQKPEQHLTPSQVHREIQIASANALKVVQHTDGVERQKKE